MSSTRVKSLPARPDLEMRDVKNKNGADEPDEEVIMTPGDDSKVGEFKNSVHDPHDFVGES